GQHVMHRDIKPQNILTLKGHAKVADFGLARELDRSVGAASVVCGTPHYMAPEVWEQRVHVNSDQYALAATYFEMRTGRRLYAAKSPFEMATAHMGGQPDLALLPEAEQAVMRRALAKQPERRYPSCVAFAKALREATAPTQAPAPAPRGFKVA